MIFCKHWSHTAEYLFCCCWKFFSLWLNTYTIYIYIYTYTFRSSIVLYQQKNIYKISIECDHWWIQHVAHDVLSVCLFTKTSLAHELTAILRKWHVTSHKSQAIMLWRVPRRVEAFQTVTSHGESCRAWDLTLIHNAIALSHGNAFFCFFSY